MIKKIFIAVIMICAMLSLTGCQLYKKSDTLIYLETVDRADIYYDKETKVMYMQDIKGTMTPMVDSEGNILLYK